MTDLDALYRSILANPDDDTPRLVYADWLEENGRPEEAEFLRAECRLERITPDDPDYTDLLDRREELRLWLTAHSPGPELRSQGGLFIESGSNWWRMTHRGFPRFLSVTGRNLSASRQIRAFTVALEKAYARIPTRWLAVNYVTVAQLGQLLNLPVLGALNHLTVQLDPTEDVRDDACRLIADCPYLCNLRGLVLTFPIGDVGAAALADSRNFANLRQLTLRQSGLCTAAAIRSFGASAWFRALHALDLGELTDAAFEELSRLEPHENLHSLELDESSFPVASWRAFADSKAFPNLSSLVNGTEMAAGQVEAFVEASGLRLSVLNLKGCAIGNAGAEALAQAPWLDSLRQLDLSYNSLSAAGVSAIAASRALARLKHLNLSYNTPGVRGLRALTANPSLHHLSTLLLAGEEQGDLGSIQDRYYEFLSSIRAPSLRHLSLKHRAIGPAAARLLTEPKFSSLRRLSLGACKLNDATVSAILNAPSLQKLVELDLAHNGLKFGLRPLADRGTLPRLSACALAENRLDPGLARELARRPGIVV